MVGVGIIASASAKLAMNHMKHDRHACAVVNEINGIVQNAAAPTLLLAP